MLLCFRGREMRVETGCSTGLLTWRRPRRAVSEGDSFLGVFGVRNDVYVTCDITPWYLHYPTNVFLLLLTEALWRWMTSMRCSTSVWTSVGWGVPAASCSCSRSGCWAGPAGLQPSTLCSSQPSRTRWASVWLHRTRSLIVTWCAVGMTTIS